MDLLILCGGYATRLRPITEKIPKVLVSVNGKPFIEYIFDVYGKYFDKIFLLAGFLGEQLKQYENEKVRVIIEHTKLDTGGAILNVLSYVSNEFVVVNGDTIVEPLKFKEFLGFSRSKMASIYVVRDDATEKGRVKLENNKVISFMEKSKQGQGFVYAGISYFKKSIFFNYTIKQTSLERKIFVDLVGKNMLYGFISSGKIYDIGTHEGLKKYEEFLKE